MVGLNYFLLLGFFMAIATMIYTLVSRDTERQ